MPISAMNKGFMFDIYWINLIIIDKSNIMKSKTVISIILARKNSKGIKNKNLVKINKKPLIYWSIINSINSKLIEKTFVSSDSLKILNFSKKYGAEIIKRPFKYAKKNTSSEKSLMHAINHLNGKIKFDTVIFIQPTSPLRKKDDFDNAIKLFKKKKFDSLFSATITHDTNIWHYAKKKLIANYNYKKRKMRQNIKEKYLENGSFYIFDKKKFENYNCRIFGKIGMYLMSKKNSFQIDDYEDINLFRKLFTN